MFSSPDKNKEVLKKIVIPEGIDLNKSNNHEMWHLSLLVLLDKGF